MSGPTPTHSSQTSRRRRAANYIAAHWRGEHSLARAFWINTILLGPAAYFLAAVAVIGILLALSARDDRILSLPAGVVSWILAPFALTTTSWQTVGLFRSAKRSYAQGGRWKPLLAALITGGYAVWIPIEYGLHFKDDLAKLRTFQKLMSQKPLLKISPSGTELLIAGDIGYGFADTILRTLQNNANIRLIDLASPGGLQHEAKLVAQTVRRRGLNTRAVSECNSACTTIFLAGRERILGNDGTLGFHGPLPLDGPDDASTLAKVYEAELRRAGLPADFARRAASTPHDAIWRPSVDELFEARVITHIETTPSRLIDILSPPSQP